VSMSDRAWPDAPCVRWALPVPWRGYSWGRAGRDTGIVLGTAGYGFATRSGDRRGQVLGVATVVLCVLSMALRSLDPPALFLES
jgi:hypothetical protein